MSADRVERLAARIAREQDALLESAAPDDKTRQLLGQRVVDRAGASARSSPRRGSLAAALAVAAGLLALGVWMTREPTRTTASLTFTVGERAGVLSAWESAPGDRRLAMNFSDGTSLELAPQARARVVAVNPLGAEIVLESGRASVHVVPRPAQPSNYLLRTGPFAVEVKGTRFDVGWDAGAEEFSLSLYEGKVEVTGCFGARREVAAGHRVIASCRQPRFELTSLHTGSAGEHSAAEREPSRPDTAEARRPEEAAQSTPPSRGESPRRSRERARGTPDWRVLARDGHFQRAYDTAVAAGFEKECERAGVDDVLMLGDAARHAGQGSRARHAYEVVRRRAVGLPSAATAAFALGRLAIDSDPQSAAEWFEASLSESPRGPLAQAARDRLFELAVRNGDARRVHEAAKKYLERAPDGPHAEQARELLRRGEPER